MSFVKFTQFQGSFRAASKPCMVKSWSSKVPQDSKESIAHELLELGHSCKGLEVEFSATGENDDLKKFCSNQQRFVKGKIKKKSNFQTLDFCGTLNPEMDLTKAFL